MSRPSQALLREGVDVLRSGSDRLKSSPPGVKENPLLPRRKKDKEQAESQAAADVKEMFLFTQKKPLDSLSPEQ